MNGTRTHHKSTITSVVGDIIEFHWESGTLGKASVSDVERAVFKGQWVSCREKAIKQYYEILQGRG